MEKGKENFNYGMYADKKVADEWEAWTKTFVDDSRSLVIYPWISNWIKTSSARNIVEIGSGTGLCSEKVELNGAEYTGVEPSVHLREKAHRLYPERRFIPGIAENLPLEDASMDAAFSVFVWLHILDLSKAAQEMCRVLRPGGAFAIVTANPQSYDFWLSWHNDTKVNGKEIFGNMKNLSNHSMYLHTMDDLTDSLTKNGFVINEVKNIKRPEPHHLNEEFGIIVSGHKK